MDALRIVGVDIGGANLKYASASGRAKSQFFPMWKQSESLAHSLCDDLNSLGEIDALAVTMTGELADCFLNRDQGVRHIVQHTIQAANQCRIGCVRFYGVDGRFYDSQKIRVDLYAASNWHALAQLTAQQISSDCLLVDIGSTTTDIVPIQDHQVATEAKTDFDRLCEGSLVYVGCRRTPVCALIDELTFRGQRCAVMNEFFATMDDARLILGFQDEKPDDTDSADGKPRTILFARNRLARMIGRDQTTMTEDESVSAARQVHRCAQKLVSGAIRSIAGDYSGQIVCSGHGADLLDLPSNNSCLNLADELGEEISRCAPAYAVARLLADILKD